MPFCVKVNLSYNSSKIVADLTIKDVPDSSFHIYFYEHNPYVDWWDDMLLGLDFDKDIRKLNQIRDPIAGQWDFKAPDIKVYEETMNYNTSLIKFWFHNHKEIRLVSLLPTHERMS